MYTVNVKGIRFHPGFVKVWWYSGFFVYNSVGFEICKEVGVRE
jgi:hypothetical protein